MIAANELSRALANRWDDIAPSLGSDRQRIEYELIPLLRQLELANGTPDQQRAVEAILALFQPFPQAHHALLRAVRDVDPGRTKGGSRPAGFVSKDRYTKFPIFFGTDRARAEGTEPAAFSGERAEPGELACGVAEVSVPDDPRMGRIDRPRWWKLQFREDPARHIVVHSIQTFSESDFVDRARGTLRDAAKKEVLVFVHGYLTGFRDALVQAAQFAYDLHFEGLAAVYSWPSEGSAPRYFVDETNVAWSRPRFARFIALLRERLEADAVHVVAHSMGNRLIVETLAAMAEPTPVGVARLNQVVFAAPDMDAATFKDFAAGFRRKAGRFTLYASSKDVAMMASKAIHKYPRAGESGLDLVVTDSLDTVDVSAVDTSLLGHSYYAKNRSILSDLFYLIRNGAAPDERFGLIPEDKYGSRYWAFRP